MSEVANRLREEAEGLIEAARKDAIEPDGTLGHWVRSQASILRLQADLADHLEGEVKGSVAAARDLSKSELEMVRKTLGLANTALDQAKAAHAGIEIQKGNAFDKLVTSFVPQMVKAVGEAVVIREWNHNKRVQWGRAAGIAVAALGILAGGYVWGSRGPGEAVLAGAVALERIRQCQAAPVKDGRTGEAYCLLKGLLPPA